MSVISRRLRSILLAGTALTIATALAPRMAQAASETFAGTVNGNFNNPLNYSPTNTPGTGDIVTYNNTGSGQPSITFSQNATSIGTLAFTQGTAYTFSLTAGQTLAATTGLTDSATAAQTFNITGVAAGITLGSLTNTGTSALSFTTNTLSNATTITGATSIGTSTLGFTGLAPVLSGSFTNGGGTLDLSGVTLNTTTAGSIAGSGGITLGGTGLSTGGLGSTTTYSGVISGAGPFSLTGGTLTLSGTNTYTGATSISNATLTAGVANTIANSGSLTFASSTFLLNGFNQTVNNLASGNASTITLGSNALTVNGASATTFGGTITGTGSVTYGGTGTLTLNNSGNTYSGGTTINSGGRLNFTTASLPGNVTDNGTLQFTNGATGTYAGNIVGTGGVEISGGIVSLSGTNTFTGPLTIDTGATFTTPTSDLGSNIVFGTGGGTLQTNANLNTALGITLTGNGTINAAGTTNTLSGIIGGAGSLTAGTTAGADSLTLSGANTYSGGTIINANTTVNLTNATASGTGAATLSAASSVLNVATSATVGGLNGVSGSTTTTGANTLTLGGTGTYSYTGTLTGTGGLVKTGTGIQSFNTANPGYSGSVNINGGTLNVATGSLGTTNAVGFAGGAIGASTTGVTITQAAVLNSGGGGTLDTTANSFTYGGAITGAGALSTAGTSNTVTLTNTGNAYTGGTNANGGTLALGVDNAIAQGPLAVGGAGTVALGVYNQSVTALTGSGAITSGGGALTAASGAFSGIYSGPGALNKTGAGTLTLSGANTYAGGTNISAGTIAAGAVNVLGSGPVIIANGATFAIGGFNQTLGALYGLGTVNSNGGVLTVNSGGFAGTIASAGTLVKTTSNGLILDGASSFTNTTVSAGVLEVGDASNANTTLGSPVTVTSGGTLAGHGTIFGNVTNSGGRVAPGGSIGTLSINGNYTSTPNSTLAIELNPTSSSRLAVSGQAAINGGTLAITPDSGTYAPGIRYTILTATGGVGGQFATVTDSSTNVFFITSYLPNEIDLTTTSITGNIAGFTPNERRASNALGAALTSNGLLSAGGGALFATILNSPSNVQVAGALGELRADIATIDLANVTSFQNFLVERMDQRQGLTSTKTANNGLPGTFDVAMNDSDMPLFGPHSGITIDQPSVWVHGYGVLGEAGQQTGYADYQYRTGGIVGGVDTLLTPGTLLGAAVAYEHTDFNLNGDTDENNIDTYRVTLYGSQKLDPVPLVLDAAFGYAFNDYHNNDFLPLSTGTGFSQTSRHTGNELTADAGLSHVFAVPQNLTSGKLTLVPRAGVEYDNIQQNPYSTTGAPALGLNLRANGSTLNALRSTIGGRADLKLTTANGTVVTPEVRASYLHDFMDTNVALTQAFTGATGAGFQVVGIHPGREAALVGTGVTVGFSERISATISYDAGVREHELDHTVQAGVKYKW